MRMLREYDRPVALIAPRRAAFSAAAFWMLAIGADATAIVLASMATGVGYHAAVYGTPGNLGDFARLGVVSAWLFVVLNMWGEEYRFERYRSLGRHPRRVTHRWAVACALTLAFAFLTKSSEVYSRGWLVLFFAGGFAAVCVGRAVPILLMRAAQNAGLVAPRRVLLVGAERDLLDFMHHYQPATHWLQVVGLPVKAREDGGGEAGRDEALRGAVAKARALSPDHIVIVAPWSDRDAIERCIDAFITVPVDLHLGPERILDRFADVQSLFGSDRQPAPVAPAVVDGRRSAQASVRPRPRDGGPASAFAAVRARRAPDQARQSRPRCSSCDAATASTRSRSAS